MGARDRAFCFGSVHPRLGAESPREAGRLDRDRTSQR
jgi:hypothetical protein